MTDPDELLRRHQPRLYFDSQEIYFADSAATWTDNPGNLLRRAKSQGGARIASAGGAPLLSLDFLAGGTYGDGATVVDAEDTISNPGRTYGAEAATLHVDPAYGNRFYGHAVRGSDHRLWLQYWFFYFYNDYAVAGFGLHEGDWETIQLRLDAHETPDRAVYAQHKRAEQRDWEKVEKDPADADRPIVYVARGSHASYFSKGSHWTGVWFDHADGKRRAKQLATLEIVADDSPGWIGWPGWWGDTRKLDPLDPLDQESPRGPSRHAQWRDPAALTKQGPRALSPPPPAPPLPRALTVRRSGGRLELDYAFPSPPAGHPAPATLVVTVNSRDDRLPPTGFAFRLSAEAGTVTLGRAVPDDQRCDVNVSAVSSRGVATEAIELDLAAGETSAATG